VSIYQTVSLGISVLAKPLKAEVSGVLVRSLTFSLEGDPDQAGQAVVQDVLQT
jgi:hypothetical protein